MGDDQEDRSVELRLTSLRGFVSELAWLIDHAEDSDDSLVRTEVAALWASVARDWPDGHSLQAAVMRARAMCTLTTGRRELRLFF